MPPLLSCHHYGWSCCGDSCHGDGCWHDAHPDRAQSPCALRHVHDESAGQDDFPVVLSTVVGAEARHTEMTKGDTGAHGDHEGMAGHMVQQPPMTVHAHSHVGHERQDREAYPPRDPHNPLLLGHDFPSNARPAEGLGEANAVGLKHKAAHKGVSSHMMGVERAEHAEPSMGRAEGRSLDDNLNWTTGQGHGGAHHVARGHHAQGAIGVDEASSRSRRDANLRRKPDVSDRAGRRNHSELEEERHENRLEGGDTGHRGLENPAHLHLLLAMPDGNRNRSYANSRNSTVAEAAGHNHTQT